MSNRVDTSDAFNSSALRVIHPTWSRHLLAANWQHYVRQIVRLCARPSLHSSLKDNIQNTSHILFNDEVAIAEWSRFLQEVTHKGKESSNC